MVVSSHRLNGSFTLHGTGTGTGNGNGTGNDGFPYYAMYCSHYTGTGTGCGTRNGDQWVAYPFTTGVAVGKTLPWIKPSPGFF